MQLIQYFSLLLPYKTITISSCLSKPEVIARLSDRFIPKAVFGEDNFWASPARYVGHNLGDCFQIDGPFGNKKWTLQTEIKLASTSQGSTLNIRLTLSLFTSFSAISALVFYGIGAIFWIKIPIWQIIVLQELFLYGLIIGSFHYEVETLLKLIKDTLKEST